MSLLGSRIAQVSAEARESSFLSQRYSVCLSVCLSHTSGLSREQRGLGRLKLPQR